MSISTGVQRRREELLKHVLGYSLLHRVNSSSSAESRSKFCQKWHSFQLYALANTIWIYVSIGYAYKCCPNLKVRLLSSEVWIGIWWRHLECDFHIQDFQGCSDWYYYEAIITWNGNYWPSPRNPVGNCQLKSQKSQKSTDHKLVKSNLGIFNRRRLIRPADPPTSLPCGKSGGLFFGFSFLFSLSFLFLIFNPFIPSNPSRSRRWVCSNSSRKAYPGPRYRPRPTMSTHDYDAVRKDIAAILQKPGYDDGSAGPVFVRLAW